MTALQHRPIQKETGKSLPRIPIIIQIENGLAPFDTVLQHTKRIDSHGKVADANREEKPRIANHTGEHAEFEVDRSAFGFHREYEPGTYFFDVNVRDALGQVGKCEISVEVKAPPVMSSEPTPITPEPPAIIPEPPQATPAPVEIPRNESFAAMYNRLLEDYVNGKTEAENDLFERYPREMSINIYQDYEANEIRYFPELGMFHNKYFNILKDGDTYYAAPSFTDAAIPSSNKSTNLKVLTRAPIKYFYDVKTNIRGLTAIRIEIDEPARVRITKDPRINKDRIVVVERGSFHDIPEEKSLIRVDVEGPQGKAVPDAKIILLDENNNQIGEPKTVMKEGKKTFVQFKVEKGKQYQLYGYSELEKGRPIKTEKYAFKADKDKIPIKLFFTS